MEEIANNEETNLISSTDTDETLQIYLAQLNRLTSALQEEPTDNISPQPKEVASKLIKNLFQSGINAVKQKKLPEGLKNISLAIEMAERKRTPYEAFAVQLQELQFMLRSKIDLCIVQGKFLDALQDLEFLLNTGMTQPEVFLRKTDVLLKLGQLEEAKVCCDRGISLHPSNPQLKAFAAECNRRLVDYYGDI